MTNCPYDEIVKRYICIIILLIVSLMNCFIGIKIIRIYTSLTDFPPYSLLLAIAFLTLSYVWRKMFTVIFLE